MGYKMAQTGCKSISITQMYKKYNVRNMTHEKLLENKPFYIPLLMLLDVCFWQSDVKLVQAIEKETDKQMEEFKCKENEVLEEITKVKNTYKQLYFLNEIYIIAITGYYAGF